MPEADTYFKYTPFDPGVPGIRLLTILPDFQDPLRCTLTHYHWEPETGQGGIQGKSSFISVTRDQALTRKKAPFPSTAHDQLQGEKQNSSKGDTLAYVALSYAWGDATQVKEVILNGRPIGVAANLWLALRALRIHSILWDNGLRSGEPCRTFWIDALCINQQDEEEKSSQVSEMHLIYRHASEVIVWLGVPDQDSDLAFELMDDIHECLQPGEFRVAKLLASTKHLLLVEKLSWWIALHRLLSRPWWSRAWTLQELLLSRRATFYCGVKSAPWPTVVLSILTARATESIVQDLVRTNRPHESWDKDSQLPYEWPAMHSIFATSTYVTWHHKIFMDRNRKASSTAVLYFLRTSQDRLCLLPEDKIYSILGLVPPEVYSKVSKPDYGQRTAQQVYMQMVRAYVEGTQNLDVICLSLYTDEQDPALPSWTPDWRRSERMLPFTQYKSAAEPSITEWHHSFIQKYKKNMPVFSHDCKTITVSGMLVGTIRGTKVEDEILQHRPQEFKKEENDHASRHFSGWKFRDVLPRLMKESEIIFEDEDMDLDEYTAHLLLGFLFSRTNTKSSRLAQEETTQTTAMGKLSTLPRKWDLDQVSNSAESILAYRTVAETESLDLCLVPYWAKPKDVVYQFAGCSAPVVLRRFNQEGFTFIGDCYVHRKPPGKMARLLEQVMKEGRELERLVLF